MSKNFNTLESAGIAYLMIEQEQKIIKFELGLKEDKAINDSITSKIIWDALPENQKTFDSYYNKFSSFMNKHNTLVQSNPRKVQISQMKMHRQGIKNVRLKGPGSGSLEAEVGADRGKSSPTILI